MKNLFSRTEGAAQDYSLHAVLFLFAIFIRVFFLIRIDEPILFFKYPFFAEKVAGGMDIGERLVDLSPFYLYFLAVLNKLFDVSWQFIKCFQIIIGAANALLVFVIGTRLFERRAAFIGALIFAAYGNLIVFETTLEPTVFVLFFNLLSVYFLILFNIDSQSPTRRIRVILTAGIFTGMGVVTKPNFLLFLPVGVVWILLCKNTHIGLRQCGFHSLLFLLTALVVIAPVTVRNYLKFDDFILVTADAGKVFFHGNSKTATAIVGADLSDDSRFDNAGGEPDYAHVLFRNAASRLTGKPLAPSESSSFWVKTTLKDIRDDPLLYLERVFKKAVHFFLDYEVHYIASAYKEYKRSLEYPFFRYGMIISLGFLGIGLSIRNFWGLLLVYETIGLYLLSCTLFLVNARYRIPVVPYFCLFAGYAIHRLQHMVVMRQFKQAGIFLLLLGTVYLSTHLFFKEDIFAHDRWQEATKACYQVDGREAFRTGKYREAIEALNRSVSLIPNFCPAYNLRGKSYAMLGEYEEAETDFRRSISLSPQSPHAYKNLGFLYLIQDKKDKAAIYLKKALHYAPNDDKVKEAIDYLK